MSNRILSYKGLIANGGQDTILLSTKKGEVGYRIKKFMIMQNTPGASSTELVSKIYTKEQTSVDGVVDFSDTTLLAAITYENDSGVGTGPNTAIILDQLTFNQDIYITAIDIASSQSTNYHIELEAMKLDESQAMVATLKDIRNNS